MTPLVVSMALGAASAPHAQPVGATGALLPAPTQPTDMHQPLTTFFEENFTNPARALALATMGVTREASKSNFLTKNGIKTPMPVIAGALPDHARVPFPSLLLPLPVDLLVIFTIGDFESSRQCSSYYDPGSPWYNVFYGAYGVRSKENDGSWWGYDAAGNVNFDEMLAVPELDYNVLTAGQLGCPPAKRIFQVLDKRTGTTGSWNRGEIVAMVPSGLHRPPDAVNANPTYYSIFGFPDPDLPGNRPSYEPVKMRGEIFFRKVADISSSERITLVWGAMCPDTPDGNALLRKIIDSMKPLYQAQ